MALVFEPADQSSWGATEVAEVMAITFEREAAGGLLWCSPRDAAIVRRWITDQGRYLSGAIRRLVRFAAVLSAADQKGFIGFLYIRIDALSAEQIQSALEACSNAGRLGWIRLSPRGIVLNEPAARARLDTGGAGFEIDYAQMPRLLALLDILCNTLGYRVVSDLLAPLSLPDRAPVDYETAAQRLERALQDWLKSRLASRHHLRQARTLRAFLASRGAVAPEAITDEVIFDFWHDHALRGDHGGIDGFRLFAGVARAMLEYRHALMDAMMQARLAEASSIDTSAGEHWIHDNERTFEGEGTWLSPLAALLSPPSARVKWLTSTEQRALANFLGGPMRDVKPSHNEDDKHEPAASTGLAGNRPFDLRFSRTLLRADVFGTAQASIIARRRKRQSGCVERVMSEISDDAYGDMRASYEEVTVQLRRETAAALHVLASAGAIEAMLLVEASGGRAAITALQMASGLSPDAQEITLGFETIREGTGERSESAPFLDVLVEALPRAAQDPHSLSQDVGRGVFLDARRAVRKVQRAGFEIPATEEALSAMRAAAFILPELIDALERLLSALQIRNLRTETQADRVAFAAVFARLYDDETN